jgi:hypothetical protein
LHWSASVLVCTHVYAFGNKFMCLNLNFIPKPISVAFRDFPAKDSRTNHRLLTVFYQLVFVVFAELEEIQCQSPIVSLHFSDYFSREFPCFYFEFLRFSLARHFPPRLSSTINLTNLMISSRNLIKIGKCYLFDDFSWGWRSRMIFCLFVGVWWMRLCWR